jgi:hypothetical protein
MFCFLENRLKYISVNFDKRGNQIEYSLKTAKLTYIITWVTMVDILDIDISISWELFHNNRIIEKNEKLSTIIFLMQHFIRV